MQEKIFDAALALIEANGWDELNFAEIAAQAKVSLDQVYDVFPERNAIITAIAKQLDKETLQNIEPFSSDDTYRDKLFAVLMARFDAAAKYKKVIRQLWRHPLLALTSAPQGMNSMLWMLEAANVDVAGAAGYVKAQMFGVFYLTAVDTWLKDDSADLAETMAYLDRGLEKLEMLPGFY